MKISYEGIIKWAERLMWPVGGILGIILADSMMVLHPRIPEYKPKMCYSSPSINPYSVPEVPVVDAPHFGLPTSVSDLEKMSLEEVIKAVSTPEQALEVMCLYLHRNGLDSRLYGKYQAPFSQIHDQRAPMDCTEGTEVAVATLSDNGYSSVVVSMDPPRRIFDYIRGLSNGTTKLCVSRSNNEVSDITVAYFGHQIFLYRQSDAFHYLDINDCVNGQDLRGFLTVEELVKTAAERINMPVAFFCVYNNAHSPNKNGGKSMAQVASENQNTTCYPR